MSTEARCIFCKIISGNLPGEILYQDEEIAIFRDIKPAVKFHFLACPKVHIADVKSLGKNHKDLVEKLVSCGKRLVEDQGGDSNDIRMGFHIPPFNTISHLHLHVISPDSELSTLGRIKYKPGTWWFASVEQIYEKLEKQ